MTSKYDIHDVSLSSEDSDKQDLGLNIKSNSSTSDDSDIEIKLPVRYLSSQINQKLDASHHQPNYSSLKKKTVSENIHTVAKGGKKGPVFYQTNIESSSDKKQKQSNVSFYQAKGEDTSSTTTESSETTTTTEEEETLSKLKEKPTQMIQKDIESKAPIIPKNLLDSFIGINLSNVGTNLLMKNLDTKLNYNDNIMFNASESGNAFDEQNLKKISTLEKKTPLENNNKNITILSTPIIKKTSSSSSIEKKTSTSAPVDNKKPLYNNNSYNVYLNKSIKSKEFLENLSLPYHCHMRGMCKGEFSNKNKKVHQFEKTDDSLVNDITDSITNNNISPISGKDIVTMILFSRKYADFEEQKFIMISKDMFNQEVITKDYAVSSVFGTHVIMIKLDQKPRFDEFFKDQGLSKIIKLNFHIPGKSKKCGFLFYLSDEGMYDEDRKIFIHRASNKEDKAPPIILVFNKYTDGLRLDNLWIFYGEKQEITSEVNDINEDIKNYVNSYMNNKKK